MCPYTIPSSCLDSIDAVAGIDLPCDEKALTKVEGLGEHVSLNRISIELA